MRVRVCRPEIDTPSMKILCRLICNCVAQLLRRVAATDLNLPVCLLHRDISSSLQIADQKIRVGREDTREPQRMRAGVLDDEPARAVAVEFLCGFGKRRRLQHQLSLSPGGGDSNIGAYRVRSCARDRKSTRLNSSH